MKKTLAARLAQSALARGLVTGAALAVSAGQTFAAESAYATQAGTAVGGSQTDLTFVYATVLTLVIAIWSVHKVIGIFGRK